MDAMICSFNEKEKWIRKIREDVFVKEQNVSREEEFEGDDHNFVHVVVTENGKPLGTGRLGADGRVGRVAVVKEARGMGVGRIVMQTLEKHARESGMDRLWAHAQIHALAFYEGLGYRAEGNVFMEADIPHKTIRKSLDVTS
jgi:predicted GNAT family N-acyltransferase